jgi:hypothetical protein
MYAVVDDIEDYADSTIKPMQSQVYFRFLDPDFMTEDMTAVRDLEVAVVHELLHLRFFYCHPHSGKFNPHIEQAIETTAIAMVAAKRGVSIKEIV